MSLRVCPIAHGRAPARKVWSFLSQPANYALRRGWLLERFAERQLHAAVATALT